MNLLSLGHGSTRREVPWLRTNPDLVSLLPSCFRADDGSQPNPYFGQKYLGVSKGGTLEIHGKKKLSWTFLNKTLHPGGMEEGGYYFERSWGHRGVIVHVIDPKTGAVVHSDRWVTLWLPACEIWGSRLGTAPQQAQAHTFQHLVQMSVQLHVCTIPPRAAISKTTEWAVLHLAVCQLEFNQFGLTDTLPDKCFCSRVILQWVIQKRAFFTALAFQYIKVWWLLQ